jgi:hypothetical protein
VVGQGTALTGTFAAINWGTGTHFLAIELNTGNGFVAMGTTQLLSVPYALYANSAGNSQGVQGPAGQDGKNTLVNTTSEPAGTNCPNGGTKIDVGLDADGNGILDTGEVNSSLTKYVCNGQTPSNSSVTNGSLNSSHNMILLNTAGIESQWVVPNGVYQIEISMNGSIGGLAGTVNLCPIIGYGMAGGASGDYGTGNILLNVIPNDVIKYYLGNNGTQGTHVCSNGNFVTAGTGSDGELSFVKINDNIIFKIIGGRGATGTGRAGNYIVPGTNGLSGYLDMSGIENSGFFPTTIKNIYSSSPQTLIIRY